MSTKQLSAPQVFPPAGSSPLNEISVKAGSYVNIVITGLAGGTEVTAYFKVEGEQSEKHHKGTAVAGEPLKLQLDSATYKNFVGKKAKIDYAVNKIPERSTPLELPIVA